MTTSILDDRPPHPILVAALHANRVQAMADAERAWADGLAERIAERYERVAAEAAQHDGESEVH